MHTFFERLKIHRQDPSLEIEQETALTLALRNGRVRTVFDRLSRAVTRQGKVVATFGTIQHVRIRKDSDSDEPDAWLVTLQLSGSRVFQVGRTTDSKSASIAAAHIATITGTRVVA